MDGPPSGLTTPRMGRTDETANPKTRACSNCARLKMKCQWPTTGAAHSENTCSRCNRMKIPCHVPVLPPRKKRGKGTRVAQLESKIDGLVSLLAAGQPLPTGGSSPPTPESQESAHVNQQVYPENINRPTEGNRSPMPLLPIPDSGPYAYEMMPEFQLTTAQAERYLDVFRQDYSPRFPFVIISPDTSTLELFTKETCLFWAIMSSVAPLHLDLQLAVKNKVRGYFADHVIVKKEKTIGNLQAILVHLAWSEFHIFYDSNATSLLSLAHSLLIDLKLDKSVKAMAMPPRTLLRDAWDTFRHTSIRQKPELSLDEKRALLCYYHQSALVAAFYRRGQAPPWTGHYTQCCESLVEASQSHADRQLVTLVNVQRIFDRALSSLAVSSGSDTVYSAPLDMTIKNVRQEVEDLISRQPKSVQNDKFIRLTQNSLLLRLYEPVFIMHPESLFGSSSSEPLPRTECLWKALQASTDFFDTYLQVPPAELTFMPSTYVALHAFGNVATSRILTVDASPDWDPSIARRAFDYVGYLARISELYDTADKLAQQNGWKCRVMDNGMPAFSKFSSKLHWISQWYMSRVNPEQHDAPQMQQSTANCVNPQTAVEYDWADRAFEGAWQDLMSVQDPTMFENFGFDAF